MMFRSEPLIFSSAATRSGAVAASRTSTKVLSLRMPQGFGEGSWVASSASPGASPTPSGNIKGEACVSCASTSAIRVHYNAPSCHGCKAFFRRSVFEGRQYVCNGENSCDVANESRNRCRACRFRKCLEGGMNPRQVREERTKPGNPPDVIPQIDIGASSVEANGSRKPSASDDLTQFLCSLEHQTEQLSDDDVQPDMRKWSRDITLTFGLQNPRLVIKRSRINWNCDRVMNSDDIYSQWYRAFVLHADWAMGIPEFRQLPLQDQTQLFKQNFMAFGWITYAYHSYEKGFEEIGLPLGNGSYIPYKDEDQERCLEERWRKSYGVVCQKLLELIAKPMKQMEMTFEEHCLLKTISLFQKDCPLSEAGQALCSRAMDRLLDALAVHIQSRFPQLTSAQRTARALRCSLLLPSFNYIGQIESSMIQNLSSIDISELGGVPMEILNTHRQGNGYK